MAQQNILFYSDQCTHSKNFINKLSQAPNGLYDTFLRINVYTQRHKVPPIIRSVPTIIVQNCNRPLVGAECLAWLEKMCKLSDPKTNNEPESYQPMEMGSNFSGSFSYMSDTGDGSLFIPGSKGTFFHLGEDSNMINAPTESNKGRKADNEIKNNRAFENFQKQRDVDMPRAPIRM